MNKKYLSAALLSATLAFSVGSFTSCKDYDDDVNNLQQQIDSNQKTLDEKLAALTSATEKATTELAAAKAAAEAAKTKAEAAAAAAAAAQATGDAAGVAAAKAAEDAAKAAQAAAAASQAAAQAKIDAIAEATRLTKELKTVVDGKVDKTVYDAKMAQIDGAISLINGKITSLEAAQQAIKQQIQALEQFKTLIEGLNLTQKFPALQQEVATLKGQLTDINAKILANSADIAAIKTQLEGVAEDINKLQTGLSTLTNLLSHRLTSLVFAPSDYMNGIEVINFSTLQYKAWTKLLADATDGTKTTSINDGKTTAYYYANPSTVLLSDITKVSVLTQDASNTITTNTRAGELISATVMSIDPTGKIEINFKKNTAESFNKPGSGNKEHFIVAALKADIKTTQDELDKGLKPTVISDWVRLAENAVTPYIHDKAYQTEVGENFPQNKAPHFYPYSVVNNGGANAVSTTGGKYIYAQVPYTETLDLKTIANVCDKQGATYNAADYKLAFEFNLVNYNLRADGEEMTNQKEFAKITDGILSSQSRDGQPNNRSAIGREPMVQVILRNTANSDVVDVRYMKVKWVSKHINNDLGLLNSFTANFDKNTCGKVYKGSVGTALMNDKIYAALDMSKEQFHASTTLDSKVYLTLEDAKAGNPSTNKRGTIIELMPEGSTTTYNLEWSLPISSCPITAAEYAAGKAERVVYGRYINNLDASTVYTFELKYTLTVAQMSFNAGYNQSYWNHGAVLSNTNKDKVFQLNPSLTDDAMYGVSKFFDCQLVGNILKGYNKNTGSLTSPVDLITGATNANFVFDAARIQSVLGTGWSVSQDGTTLKYGATTAAVIDGNNIRLYENPLPTVSTHGRPSDAAISLLGKNVPVKLVASYCEDASAVDHDFFLVNFINPLAVTVCDVEEAFKDLLTGGSTIKVKDIASIKETFGLKRMVWEKGAPVNALLGQWYHVENVTWDLANAKTNLKREGQNIVISNDNLASNWNEFASMYKITASPNEANAETLTFHNNSGVHLQQGFTISIPVYAKTKWSATLYDSAKKYVIVRVTPGETKSMKR